MYPEVDLQNETACVLDFGGHVAVAQRLARDFGRVLYWSPSVINGYEGHEAADIGRGVPGIIKVKDWEDYREEIGTYVFTDIYLNGLQESLKREGKAVFGSGRCAELEKDRTAFKDLLTSLELPVNDYDTATGVYELIEKLKDVDDRYIKSGLRGDMESWHHTNYALSRMELKRMCHDMGVYDKQEKYIIESPIEAIAEIGYDGFFSGGSFPEITCNGLEIKDVGYVGRMVRYSQLPKQVKDSLDKLTPILMNYGYQGAISTEVRVDKDKVGYLIDPTLRMPEPNTSLILEMYENFSQIVWDVAHGVVPTIKYKFEYGVEFIICSEMAKSMPVAIQFPPEYERFVKIKNLVVDDDGTYYFTKNAMELEQIGAVIGLGHSMEQAINMATKIASTVKGFDIKIKTDCIVEAQKQIKELSKNGIRFI